MVRSVSAAGAMDHELAQLLRDVDATADRAKVIKKKPSKRTPHGSASAATLITPVRPQQPPSLLPPLQMSAPVKRATAWTTPSGDAASAGAKTMAARVRVSEPNIPSDEDVALDVSPLLRSPTFSPRRTSRLGGTTLTTSLEFVDRDLSLNRSAAKAGKGSVVGQALNVTTAEAWLEDMLELVKPNISTRNGAPPDSSHGMERAMIDRSRLQVAGMDTAQVGRLYQLLFVHSFGMHQSLSVLLDQLAPEPKAEVAVCASPPHLPCSILSLLTTCCFSFARSDQLLAHARWDR